MTRRKRRHKKRYAHRILIVCEGPTERIYFQGIKESDEFRSKGMIELIVEDPNRNDPLGLVKKANTRKNKERQFGNPFDSVWTVFDKNHHDNHAEAFRFADNNAINIAFSSISFEMWVLLHYKKTTRAFRNADEVIREITTRHQHDYRKTGRHHYKILRERTETALANAHWLRNQKHQDFLDANKNIYRLNPYVTVDNLVAFLNNLQV